MPGKDGPRGTEGMRPSRWEAILAGEGGQGLVVAGIVLGEAAILEGLEAVQSQWVLGSATRGSLSRSEVVISRDPIAFPRVRRAGALLALTRAAFERHRDLLAPEALVIVDEDHVPGAGPGAPEGVAHRLPVVRTAGELGLARSTNMIALGALVALSGVLEHGSIERAIMARFGAKAIPNLEAYRTGARLAGARLAGAGPAGGAGS